MKRIAIVVLVTLILACNSAKQDPNTIPIDTMKVVVLQLMQADAFYDRQVLLDSTWKVEKKNVQFYQQIFDYHKVNSVQFFKQMRYLQTHPIAFKVLMDSVDALSKREKNDMLKH